MLISDYIRMGFYAKFDVHAMTIAKRTMELTLLARKYFIYNSNIGWI